MLVAEAKVCAALNHPNIITIHDVDEVYGTHFIVMQYVEAGTLKDMLGQPVSLTATADISAAISPRPTSSARVIVPNIRREKPDRSPMVKNLNEFMRFGNTATTPARDSGMEVDPDAVFPTLMAQVVAPVGFGLVGLIAAGLIAGESITGVVFALMK